MRVVLVHRWQSSAYPEAHLGLAYLASYVKRRSDRYDFAIVTGSEHLEQQIIEHRPDIVGFYSYTAPINEIERIREALRGHFDGPALLGGPHISALPDKLPKAFDVGVVGEGEETFLELLELLRREGKYSPSSLRGIAGISYHEDDAVAVTARRPPYQRHRYHTFPCQRTFC
jgi:radical SAM superfamily enzyme YgiQ (UPF0313 family)